jgi:hypothetical protein
MNADVAKNSRDQREFGAARLADTEDVPDALAPVTARVSDLLEKKAHSPKRAKHSTTTLIVYEKGCSRGEFFNLVFVRFWLETWRM